MVVRTEANLGPEKRSLNIPVLYIVKCAQNQHGLRHGDYQRYQKYVTRKLRRMRKSLRLQQGVRSRVVPKKLTPEIVTEVRHLVLAVFEIERSWAFAMQLKAEANSEPRKRFHMISRLRKAAKRAQMLNELIGSVPSCGAQTTLELTAYIKWICGIQHFELQDWRKAKELLETSQQIYTGLAASVDEDIKPIYQGRISELLPQIRYCDYSIGDASAASDLREMRAGAEGALAEDQLDDLLKQIQTLQAGSVTEITWLGTRIPVKFEKARLAVLAVQEADEELKKLAPSYSKATICESTLKVIAEAIAAIREEMRSLSNSDASGSAPPASTPAGGQSGASGIEKLPRLQRLNAYLQYLKLTKTIWRTLHQLDAFMSTVAPDKRHVSLNLVTSGYHKPQEFARLYDTVMQSLQDVHALPNSSIQDNSEIKAALKAKILAYKCLKCYYLSLAYLQAHRFLESSSLLQRCESMATDAITALTCEPVSTLSPELEVEAVPGHPVPFLAQLLRDVSGQAATEVLACKAGYMLELAAGGVGGVGDERAGADVPKAVLKEPLINSLGEFVPENILLRKLTTQPFPLVPFPPEFEPVAVKPVFFDLALNHIVFPPQPRNVGGEGEDAAGITGFVKGLWWGQSKK